MRATISGVIILYHTPSSASVVTIVAGCARSTSMVAVSVGASVALVTIMGVATSAWAGAGTILICRGGGGVAATGAMAWPTAPPPRGLAWSGGGATECTICWRRGGGGVFCICCRGGGWRAEGSLGMMILVTVDRVGVGAVGGAEEAGGLWANVRERVVTCGRSMMMFDVQMLVMVLLSGACTGMRLERVGVG